jgi:AcrR family transcriptional regulator
MATEVNFDMLVAMSVDARTPRPGLRERKKEQTRRLIAHTARRLFAERGFDAVTVAEVARAADVAEKTVFNYFSTKEDLFYSGMEAFEEQLLDAVRDREPGETVLAAFRRFVLRPQGVFAMRGDGEDDRRAATERLRTITRVITESPALLARERHVLARYTDALAAVIAEETGAGADDVEPLAAAHALIGVHRSLIEFVRRRVAAGATAAEIADALLVQGEQALALLEHGLGEYAPRR